MQKFFMIIGKNKLNVYSTNGGQWEKQYFEGNPEFEYEVNNARHDIEKMFELLVSEYNLDSKAELEFSVLCNEDSVYNDVIERCMKDYICEKIMRYASGDTEDLNRVKQQMMLLQKNEELSNALHYSQKRDEELTKALETPYHRSSQFQL